MHNTIFFSKFALLLKKLLTRKALCPSFGVKHRSKSLVFPAILRNFYYLQTCSLKNIASEFIMVSGKKKKVELPEQVHPGISIRTQKTRSFR